MNRPIKIAAFTFVSWMLTSPVHAVGTSSAQFLKMGAGARAAAMGDAFVSVADDAAATYWNPAGMRQLKHPELSLMQANTLMQTQYQFLGAVLPIKNSAVGFVVQRMDYGSLDSYSAQDVKTGNFQASSMAGGLCAAVEIFKGATFGVTGKYISETIQSNTAKDYAADIGIMLDKSLLDGFNFGITVQNLGSGIKFLQESSPLPQTLRFGLSTLRFHDHLLTALDYSLPNDNTGTIHAGIEYKINSAFILRGGYQSTPGNNLKVDGLKNVSAGVGINIRNFDLDYAFVPYGDLGQMHRISALIHFRP